MRKKFSLANFISGMLAMALIFSGVSVVSAATRRATITVDYGFNVYVEGVRFEPRDSHGIIESFNHNGWIWAPFEHIAVALGKEAYWDGATRSLFLGRVPGRERVRTVFNLFSQPLVEVDNIGWFNASGDERENMIRLKRWSGNWGTGTRSNHVTYSLGMLVNAEFRGTLIPMGFTEMTKVYRFFGDGRLLYTSPIIHSGASPIPVEINVSGVRQLRIEVDITNATAGNRFISNANAGNFGGIQNAVIVTRE